MNISDTLKNLENLEPEYIQQYTISVLKKLLSDATNDVDMANDIFLFIGDSLEELESQDFFGTGGFTSADVA